MCNAKKAIGKLLGIIIFLLTIPATLFGEEINKSSSEESKSKPNFVLTIKDNLISLDAKDASLVKIVEEIGNRMKIDVITKIPEERKVKVVFDELPLESAIERLREFADIAYIKDSEKKEAKITKILVFPKGKGEELSKSTKEEESVKSESREEETVEEEAPQMEAEEEEVVEEEAQRPEPFKFEFDPSEFEEE